jgi:parvulin-like peptidyl-prolyl isomerase
MKSSRILLSLVVALLALVTLVAAGCGGDDDVPADAVAVVDGTVITKQQLDDLLARAKKSYASQDRQFPKAGTSEYTALQNQAVAYLVQREEYVQEADELGITVTEKQIDDKVVEITKQYFGGDKAKLQQQLKAQGYDDAAFREDVEAQILSEAIFAKVAAGATVTDEDVKKYYEENKAQYTVAESRKVRHILVKTKAEADEVLSRLDAGEDFAALAKELSTDPGSKDSGGELTIQKGQTVEPFEKSSFSLAVNEISQPIKTEFGYHVIQALGPVKAATTTPLASAEEAIRATLLEEKKNQAVQDWSNDLEKRYKGKITYQTGYQPPSTDTDTSTDG